MKQMLEQLMGAGKGWLNDGGDTRKAQMKGMAQGGLAAGAMALLLGNKNIRKYGTKVAAVGGAAVLTGRAIGSNWKPASQVIAACFGLALVDRFLIYALFQGTLVSFWGILVHYVVLLAMGLTSWRIARVSKMVGQYPWLYERTSPFAFAALRKD